MELHRGLMTLYFKSRGIWVRNVLHKMENQNSPNSGLSAAAHPNMFPVGEYVQKLENQNSPNSGLSSAAHPNKFPVG